ncbi:MAG: 4-hydroxy-tetrahydrodipicolinate reductase [Woeseiaceae bacterium]
MKKVGISGANGKMGRLAISVIEAAADLSIAWLYAPGREGQEISGYKVDGDISSLSDCDVVIELTNPAAADENVPQWLARGFDLVIGTSGFTESRIASLEAQWSNAEARCLLVPNFAIGAVLMMRFAEQAAPYFESAEIVEMHHHTKPDAPSGTALHTAARMAKARTGQPHSRGEEIVSGALGANVDDIPVHSLRVQGAAAHQEVILGTVGQYLTVRHDTVSYDCFSPGMKLALQQVSTLEPGLTVGLEGLLGI